MYWQSLASVERYGNRKLLETVKSDPDKGRENCVRSWRMCLGVRWVCWSAY